MTDKQVIIDASKCEWRTGVEHCGNYECMLNKCCDYNCDWYKRRKLEQQLKRKEQECEELKEKLDKYLDQEEEEIRQLNNDNKLDEILESIKKANEQIAKEIKYKKALEAIEAYCNVILADRCHYSEGAILMTEKLMREYISKTKE